MNKGGASFADAIVMGSKELDKNLIKFAKGLKKPVLEYIGKGRRVPGQIR